MRALFDYEPESDELNPCRQAGLNFRVGDILEVILDLLLSSLLDLLLNLLLDLLLNLLLKLIIIFIINLL